jgi:Predicted metal-dependent phosphoesterases (PHP family)
MPRIDLHTHSNRSDGTFPPAEVIRLAAERDLDVVALTDHDTTDGLPEALATGLEAGVEVVPGVEFSAEYLGTSVHVLCYWMDVEDAALQLELRRLREDRYRRGELMVEKLGALGCRLVRTRPRDRRRRHDRPPAHRAGDGRRPVSSPPRRRRSSATSATAGRRTRPSTRSIRSTPSR